MVRRRHVLEFAVFLLDLADVDVLHDAHNVVGSTEVAMAAFSKALL